ncbi:MAG: hypothetical protein ISR46_03660, partial [Rhodospirillales bacterium]|nr:hypothetical protein [Rhodospirillales bacterium]
KKKKSLISPYCEAHSKRKRRTGDPLGSRVPASVLNPVIKEAAKYITINQKAIPIEAGLKYCRIWLQSGYESGGEWREKTPQQIVDSLIHRLKVEGVDPTKVLATLSAFFYLHNYHPETFRSDDHFRHQLVKSLLSLTPLPIVKYRRVSGYLERAVHLEITPKTIVKGYDTIRIDALMLAVKIADRLNEPDDWKHNILGRMKYPVPKHLPQEEANQSCLAP